MYEKRDEFLTTLNYENYNEYLSSPLWKRIRADVASQTPYCQCCGSIKGLRVHHSQYTLENLKGESHKYLLVVCKECHSRLHNLHEYKSNLSGKLLKIVNGESLHWLEKSGRVQVKMNMEIHAYNELAERSQDYTQDILHVEQVMEVEELETFLKHLTTTGCDNCPF